MLHVRHAGHRHIAIGFRLQQERIQHAFQGLPDLCGRINNKQAKIGGHFLYDFGRHVLQLSRISADQRVFADGVDESGNAARVAIHFRDRICRKQHSKVLPYAGHL